MEPISLRLRDAEVTARARRLLRRLEAERLVKHHAARALSAAYDMGKAAEIAIRLKSMSSRDREQWKANHKRLTAVLLEISRWGIGS